MSEVLFDVVFKGKFISKIDKPRAVLHFSKLFKLPTNKAERFFDGKARILKKSLDLGKASHFRAALKKAGLRVSLVKQQLAEESQDQALLTMSEPGVVIVNKAFSQPKHFNTSQFDLDEVGAEIVEHKQAEKREFDLSGMDVEEVGTQIIEKQHVPELHIDISQLTLDEVGAVFAHKKHIEKPDLDIDSLSMDEVGVVFATKEKIAEPKINIDNINLQEPEE